MRRRSKRYLLFVAFVLFLSSYIASSILFAYFRKVYLPEFFNVYRKLIFSDDISCYRTSESPTNYIYAPNSIFFYQTACRKTIRLHEACSIEAAARLHPNKTVYIIVLNDISAHDAVLKEVEKYDNVKISRINIESFVKSTPFDDLYDIIYKVKRRHKVMSDLLKIITLFKYGGTALNLDITVTKSLSKLGKHWFIKDNGSIYPVLKLSNDLIGRAAAGMVMSNLRSQADNGYVNVENAVEAALGDLCSVLDVNKMNNSTCSGYKIYDIKIFRPIDYEHQELYLEPVYVRSNFGYQTWLDAVRILPRDSLYCTIARNFCPFIYGEFMEDFVKDYY